MGVSCKKSKESPEDELSKLPPITQTGANTFGCLVNGKAWTPKGWDGRQPNFFIIVDPTFRNGDFSLRTYRLDNSIYESYVIGSDSINATSTYIISDIANTRIIYHKGTPDLSQIFCTVSYNGNFQRTGYLRISKYDLQSGIVSGEFEFTMVNKDCGNGDIIKVTKGRFDYKL